MTIDDFNEIRKIVNDISLAQRCIDAATSAAERTEKAIEYYLSEKRPDLLKERNDVKKRLAENKKALEDAEEKLKQIQLTGLTPDPCIGKARPEA